MKKLLIMLGLCLCFTSTSWALTNTTPAKEGYELYEYRVDSICKKKKPEQIFIQTDEYLEYSNSSISNVSEGDDLITAKQTFRNNMGSIYKCGLLGVQQKSLTLVETELLRFSPSVSKKIVNKIRSKQTQVELMRNNLECRSGSKGVGSLQKLEILQQATFEICKYHSYLEYLKERSSIISSQVNDEDQESYSISRVAKQIEQRQTDIEEEILRSYKVFPLAFQAYSEYENNYPIHILLELLRDDFLVLKQELHHTINPINQVVYKISNAMTQD